MLKNTVNSVCNELLKRGVRGAQVGVGSIFAMHRLSSNDLLTEFLLKAALAQTYCTVTVFSCSLFWQESTGSAMYKLAKGTAANLFSTQDEAS